MSPSCIVLVFQDWTCFMSVAVSDGGGAKTCVGISLWSISLLDRFWCPFISFFLLQFIQLFWVGLSIFVLLFFLSTVKEKSSLWWLSRFFSTGCDVFLRGAWVWIFEQCFLWSALSCQNKRRYGLLVFIYLVESHRFFARRIVQQCSFEGACLLYKVLCRLYRLSHCETWPLHLFRYF